VPNNLSLLHAINGDPPRLERTLLKDRATELLRDYIVNGRIPSGTKLVEREVAQWLGISRAPIRDALIQLEKEGLVVSKSDARYVITLTERDIRELSQVRRVLEKLAAELAARNSSPENRAALLALLQKMKEGLARRDHHAYRSSDVEIHRLIWSQADNDHLAQALNSTVGPIFMFVAGDTEHYDWDENMAIHEDLVAHVANGDVVAAQESIDRHSDYSLAHALRVCRRGSL